MVSIPYLPLRRCHGASLEIYSGPGAQNKYCEILPAPTAWLADTSWTPMLILFLTSEQRLVTPKYLFDNPTCILHVYLLRHPVLNTFSSLHLDRSSAKEPQTKKKITASSCMILAFYLWH